MTCWFQSENDETFSHDFGFLFAMYCFSIEVFNQLPKKSAPKETITSALSKW